LNDALAAARRAVTLAQERFERGLTDSLNVIDAQRQAYDLEQPQRNHRPHSNAAVRASEFMAASPRLWITCTAFRVPAQCLFDDPADCFRTRRAVRLCFAPNVQSSFQFRIALGPAAIRQTRHPVTSITSTAAGLVHTAVPRWDGKRSGTEHWQRPHRSKREGSRGCECGNAMRGLYKWAKKSQHVRIDPTAGSQRPENGRVRALHRVNMPSMTSGCGTWAPCSR
jgi:hypothetical protein